MEDEFDYAFHQTWERTTAIPVQRDAMLVDGVWWAPKFGSDTMQHMMDILRGKE